MISSANAEIINLLCNISTGSFTEFGGYTNIIIDINDKTVKRRSLQALNPENLDLYEFELFKDGVDVKDSNNQPVKQYVRVTDDAIYFGNKGKPNKGNRIDRYTGTIAGIITLGSGTCSIMPQRRMF
jgi:hypothetical protein